MSAQVVVQRDYNQHGGTWRLTYGYEEVRICSGWRTPTQRLIEKALKRARRRHLKEAAYWSQRAEVERSAKNIAATDDAP